MRAAGSVALTCDVQAERTRLRTIRCDGLSRSSRAFAVPGGAIRVMLATLGPGVLGGDRFTLAGTLEPNAALTAGTQMATPVFAGGGPSCTDVAWRVDEGAVLHVAGEPLLLEPESTHRAVATFALADTATAMVTDTFALRGSARLSLRTSATIAGTLVYRDALEVDGGEPGAFGTVVLVTADAARRAAFAAHAAQVAARAGPVRIGVGATAAAVVVRIAGARVWDVRSAGLRVARG